MEMPNIQNTLRDLGRGITYHVMAYRILCTELMQAVAVTPHPARSVKRS